MEPSKTYMTKAEHARQHIQSMILAGTVGPGDRITTREVSSALGISETPIREAIRSLASEGWLEVQNHIGAVVQGLRAEQIREISALRGLVCGLAVELGAKNFDAARFKKIDENIEISAEVLKANDFDLFCVKNHEFHRLLCDNPQSPWCHRLLENMYGLISAQRHGLPPQPERLREALREHIAIRDKLRAGDYAAAAGLVKQHERNTGDFLIDMIARTPVGGWQQ